MYPSKYHPHRLRRKSYFIGRVLLSQEAIRHFSLDRKNASLSSSREPSSSLVPKYPPLSAPLTSYYWHSVLDVSSVTSL